VRDGENVVDLNQIAVDPSVPARSFTFLSIDPFEIDFALSDPVAGEAALFFDPAAEQRVIREHLVDFLCWGGGATATLSLAREERDGATAWVSDECIPGPAGVMRRLREVAGTQPADYVVTERAEPDRCRVSP